LGTLATGQDPRDERRTHQITPALQPQAQTSFRPLLVVHNQRADAGNAGGFCVTLGHHSPSGEKREMPQTPQITSLPQRLRRQATQALDKLALRSFETAKTRYQRQCESSTRRYGDPSPLLIYTMGKVGSSSVLHSLRLLELDRPLYHLHSLDLESLHELEEELRPAFPDPQALVSLRHVWRCQYVRQKLSDHPEKKIHAITLIRDPIARNLSDFFQHIHVENLPPTSGGERWKLTSSFFDFETIAGEEDVSELIELYFAKEWHDFPALWIDRELNGVLGIDVYASPFSREQGYAIYQSERAHLLLVRLHDLNRCAAQALREFLGLDPFTLVNANVAEDKEYVDVYRAFKAAITFPESYLESIYSSRLVTHFYSQAEVLAFRERWCKIQA